MAHEVAALSTELTSSIERLSAKPSRAWSWTPCARFNLIYARSAKSSPHGESLTPSSGKGRLVEYAAAD